MMSETDQFHQFEVTAQSASPTKTIVETGDFEFTIDEPEALGEQMRDQIRWNICSVRGQAASMWLHTSLHKNMRLR